MKTIKYIGLVMFTILFSSCLKMNLNNPKFFDKTDVTAFNFEYRWMGDNNGNARLFVQKMETKTTIDTDKGTITCEVTVPSASDTGAKPTNDFPTSVRNKVTLKEMVGYADISEAANISPIGKSPALGKIQDFSGSAMKYKVVAADGKTTKEWTLIIKALIK